MMAALLEQPLDEHNLLDEIASIQIGASFQTGVLVHTQPQQPTEATGGACMHVDMDCLCVVANKKGLWNPSTASIAPCELLLSR